MSLTRCATWYAPPLSLSVCCTLIHNSVQSYKEQSKHLAGQIGFLKMFCTQSGQDTARDAVQIFGGRGITKTGMGRIIEMYHRTIPFDSLLGGAEDVLGDLGVRQAMRQMPKNARL